MITSNRNFLTNTNFTFALARAPNINYFVTRVGLPSISLPPSNSFPTPLSKVVVPGDQIQFGTVDLTFKIDEDMHTYTEIADWMFGLGFPESTYQYRELASQAEGFRDYSDGTLSILNSNFNPVMVYTFIDMFPTNMSSIEMSSGEQDVPALEMTVSFAFTRFTYRRPG